MNVKERKWQAKPQESGNGMENQKTDKQTLRKWTQAQTHRHKQKNLDICMQQYFANTLAILLAWLILCWQAQKLINNSPVVLAGQHLRGVLFCLPFQQVLQEKEKKKKKEKNAVNRF